MKLIKYSIINLVLITFSNYVCAQDFWRCDSNDEVSQTWSSSNKYQKTALNVAYDQCKKNSRYPKSCKISVASCHHFIDGQDTTPMWQCTAVDQQAEAWKSAAYPNRDDAAMGAKDYCKDKSGVPETCFLNMITCTNINSVLGR